MRALITGATGFLGRSLVRRLTQQGHDVTALVRPRSRSEPDPVDELRGYRANTVEGTVFDADALAEAIENRDVIFHLGWQWHRPNISGAPDAGTTAEQWHVNVEGTLLLIAAAKRAGARRLIFTSTISVYPPVLPSPVSEDGPTFSPDSLRGHPAADYVAPKLAVEEMIRHLLPPPDYVILRPSMIYGIGAQFAPWMIRDILQSSPRRMVHEANWVHVDDVARAAILAAEEPEVAGMTLNIAGRETVGSDQLRSAIHRIAERLMDNQTSGVEPDFNLLTDRYDIGKARRYLGFETEISLTQGLEEMVPAALQQVLAEPQPTAPLRQPWGGSRTTGMAAGWGARRPGTPWRS
ncbi:MAG: NAD(P)-dependent oxidoreductase [Methylocella sp.]